jgi:hypothetical protein
MTKDVTKKIVEIGRRLGLSPSQIEDMETFIEAVYNYIMNAPQPQARKSDIEDLLALATGSKTLEDPVRAYLLLKTIEEMRYKDGFEDGLRVAKSKEYEAVKKKQVEIMNKFLELYEKHMIPAINTMLGMFQQFQNPQIQPQQQQSSIKIKFKE